VVEHLKEEWCIKSPVFLSAYKASHWPPSPLQKMNQNDFFFTLVYAPHTRKEVLDFLCLVSPLSRNVHDNIKSFREKLTHLLNFEVQDCDQIWHSYWSHYQPSLCIFLFICHVVSEVQNVKESPHQGKEGMCVRFFFSNAFDNALRETL
jgi:hypothetical protein